MDPHDLLRVAAHRATSILTMMTNEDEAQEEKSGGIIQVESREGEGSTFQIHLPRVEPD